MESRPCDPLPRSLTGDRAEGGRSHLPGLPLWSELLPSPTRCTPISSAPCLQLASWAELWRPTETSRCGNQEGSGVPGALLRLSVPLGDFAGGSSPQAISPQIARGSVSPLISVSSPFLLLVNQGRSPAPIPSVLFSFHAAGRHAHCCPLPAPRSTTTHPRPSRPDIIRTRANWS